MISISAFDILNVITNGSLTIHTLWVGVKASHSSDSDADKSLLNALIELCDSQLIAWSFEADYGNDVPSAPKIQSSSELVECWLEIFGTLGPRNEYGPRTIMIEATKNGAQTADSDSYSHYDRFLADWYEW